ncbi:hypothetical protein NMY3_01611 [Candidatus Nitrosocosmicus oleophilus]|uniref:Uncharacterized protein n=1 Tax=Candidatus Nitrosocosmicus oleophilus TaxID=1353260 RepID=A0A654LWH2_9ARCH|nr:hypothetical protein [Candidatus Nitrosocosmicus oleophilus]ALI35814.1 hypothetical protein NMY3_01611 [Candidatus Nitrosocosmicus oleophilus]
MSLVITVCLLVIVGLMTVYGLSVSDLVFCVDKTFYDDEEKSMTSLLKGPTMKHMTDKTLVEIVKSFKNSSGFYKINGTLENEDSIILTDIKVIKYYKIPSVNDTTLLCYEESGVRCEYKSINQLHSDSFLLNIPDPNMNAK